MSNYGIGTVVGGFGRPMSAEQSIPYVLARTYKEHHKLREILMGLRCNDSFAVDLGCGYGRNIPLLQDFFNKVVGVERDDELREIAAALNPNANLVTIERWSTSLWAPADLLLTFTFLQHLSKDELESIRPHVIKNVGRYALLCEETDPAKSDSSTTARSLGFYEEFLGSDFKLVYSAPREIEATFPDPMSGDYMLFERIA